MCMQDTEGLSIVSPERSQVGGNQRAVLTLQSRLFAGGNR
jgi:hypothetical protein